MRINGKDYEYMVECSRTRGKPSFMLGATNKKTALEVAKATRKEGYHCKLIKL